MHSVLYVCGCFEKWVVFVFVRVFGCLYICLFLCLFERVCVLDCMFVCDSLYVLFVCLFI